jgi:steroid 5-alpha reductase family enzyme
MYDRKTSPRFWPDNDSCIRHPTKEAGMVDKEAVQALLFIALVWILQNFAVFLVILFLLVIVIQLAWAIRLLRCLTWNTGKTADYLYANQQAKE